jgi:hypothetical protein
LSNENVVQRFWRIRKLWQDALFPPRGRDVCKTEYTKRRKKARKLVARNY